MDVNAYLAFPGMMVNLKETPGHLIIYNIQLDPSQDYGKSQLFYLRFCLVCIYGSEYFAALLWFPFMGLHKYKTCSLINPEERKVKFGGINKGTFQHKLIV